MKNIKKKGSDLEFISQIKRDGSGTVPVGEDYMKLLNEEEFILRRLSMSEDTYIASCFNSFVVKIKVND